MDESEAMVDDDERQADDALRTGLETAIQAQEDAIDGIVPYAEGGGSEGEETAKEEAATFAALAIREQAATAFKAEKRRLHEAHCEAKKAVDEWKEILGYAKERDRQNKQRGRLTRAILEVQAKAADRRRDAAAPDEDLCNDTVTKNWTPLLFDAMVAPSADPDVKQMALEAADKANINQIYSGAGATKQQWDAFVAERIQSPTGTVDQGQSGQVHRRHAAAILSRRCDAVAGREIGCTQHMHGWWCPNPIFDLVAGGTGCAEGIHNPNSVYPSEAAKAQAKLDYPNARGKGKSKGKGKGKDKGKGKGKGKGGDRPRSQMAASTARRTLPMGSAREGMLEPHGGKVPRHTLTCCQYLDGG
jgi:hypothetical protein